MVEEKASSRIQVLPGVKVGGLDGKTSEPHPHQGPSVVMISPAGVDPVISRRMCVNRVGTSVARLATYLK